MMGGLFCNTALFMKPITRYLILAITSRCNLNCRYCYNGFEEAGDMTEEVLENSFVLMDGQGVLEPLHIQITGGEPTLAPHLLEKAFTMALRVRRPVSVGIQTNGTKIDERMASLFKRFGVQVGVSVDGPPGVHDKQRGLAASTLKGLQNLESKGVPFRVTTVITRENVSFLPDLVLMLSAFSLFCGIGLDLVTKKGRAAQRMAPPPAEGSSIRKSLQQMLTVLRRVNRNRFIPIRLREEELIKKRLDGGGHRKNFCYALSGESLAVDWKGDFYPCGQTLRDPRFWAGTGKEPLWENLNELTQRRPLFSTCDNCSLRSFCPGECPSRLHYNKDESSSLVCEVYQAILDNLSVTKKGL